MLTDYRRKFIFENLAVRGELVRIERTLGRVLANRPCPIALQGLLGEALAAAALLAGTLKFEGHLALQARGTGPLNLLMAECTHDGHLRAIARHEGEIPDAPLYSLLGADDGGGHLAITIDPVDGQRYQGIVPLDGLSLGECIEHYFAQSEQLSTRLWLVAGNGLAAGILLQELPASGEIAPDADGWNRLCRLTDTLTEAELVGLSAEALLTRLFHQEDVRLFDADELAFACSCSRERTLNALLGLGMSELQSILAEEGRIETVCEFCNEVRVFMPEDLNGPTAQ